MEIESLDPAYVSKVLSNPPFVTISGVHNSRDLASPERPIKPGRIFRTAELSNITEKGTPLSHSSLVRHWFFLLVPGKSELRALGITTVFDLRSDTEIEKYNSPLPTIEGVEIIRTPVFQKGEYSPEKMAQYVRAIRIDTIITHSYGGQTISIIFERTNWSVHHPSTKTLMRLCWNNVLQGLHDTILPNSRSRRWSHRFNTAAHQGQTFRRLSIPLYWYVCS